MVFTYSGTSYFMASVGKEDVWFVPGEDVTIKEPSDYVEKLFLQGHLTISDKCGATEKIAFLKKVGKPIIEAKPDK